MGSIRPSAAVKVSQSGVTMSLGDLVIKGILHGPSSQHVDDKVASFRNIKYANIPGRWHEAQLLDLESQTGSLDATNWGPRSPQTVDIGHVATGHLYERLSIHDPTDEFECLNLNVYAPVSALQSATDHGGSFSALPVIVWIHGGSFEWGDGGSETDGQHLVRRSIAIGRPVIVVGINYRLGMLGFFTSEELRQEARGRGEAGYSNLGLHDQRLALQWVKNNICHFGGDGNRVTMTGESAGAVSILAHLRGRVPVARSAFVLSPATIGPKPIVEAQAGFDSICEQLGIGSTEVSASTKLAELRDLSCEELHKLGANRLTRILSEDPLFFNDWSGQRFEDLSTLPPWIGRIVVGQLRDETAIIAQVWASVPPADLLTFWRQLYNDPAYATEVLGTYGFGAADNIGNDDPAIKDRLVACVGDVLFDKAVHGISKASDAVCSANNGVEHQQVHLYRIDQPDTLPSAQALSGYAYHSLDVPLLFGLPKVAGPGAPADLQETAKELMGALLKVAYDEAPWAALKRARRSVDTSATLAVFSGKGIQMQETSIPRWSHLTSTPERTERFMLTLGLISRIGELLAK